MNNGNAIYSILQRATRDEQFKKRWNLAAEAEERFAPVREVLTQEQQKILDDYLEAREELVLAMVKVAYEVGQSDTEI